MVRFGSLAALCTLTTAVRVHDIDESNFVAVAEDVVGASKCLWDDDFDKKYINKRVVGSGATACVYLAETLSGQTVAIKVGKGTESSTQWREQCKQMQLLRADACKSSKRSGPQLYELNAMYIPTCLEVGTEEQDGQEINFYVMQAAGSLEMREIEENQFTQQERRSLLAQFIGAVWALHGLDTSHNDLHGGNILIDPSKNRLAIIDLSDIGQPLDPLTPVVPPSKTFLFDYKRDGNAVMAWSSFLLGCSAIPEFPVVPSAGELEFRAEEFSTCLEKLNVDEESLKAMQGVMNKNVKQLNTQGVERLFKSSMIQDYLPKFEPTYAWEATQTCTSWSVNSIDEFRREIEFSAMYKCETVPSFVKKQTKTNKVTGKVITKSSQQCRFQRSACYTLEAGLTWACDAGTIKGSPCDGVPLPASAGFPGKNFDGSCLMERHTEGYKYAKVFPGWTAPATTTRAPARWKPIVVKKKETAVAPFDFDAMPAGCKCSKTAVPKKAGCEFHISKSFGAYCYMDGGLEECSAYSPKLSKSKGKTYRTCYPLFE